MNKKASQSKATVTAAPAPAAAAAPVPAAKPPAPAAKGAPVAAKPANAPPTAGGLVAATPSNQGAKVIPEDLLKTTNCEHHYDFIEQVLTLSTKSHQTRSRNPLQEIRSINTYKRPHRSQQVQRLAFGRVWSRRFSLNGSRLSLSVFFSFAPTHLTLIFIIKCFARWTLILTIT
jgi:hypothetical protein